MKTAALIPAAGQGERFKSSVPKALVELDGKPLIVHVLDILEKVDAISGIVVVVPEAAFREFERAVPAGQRRKKIDLVAGGATRAASVRKGLAAVDPEAGMILIHDAARPLVDRDLVEQSIKLCAEHKAVVAAVPVTDTIKQADPARLLVEKTLDRSLLWQAQTPQVFDRELLTRALGDNQDLSLTDEAALIESIGHPVKILPGSYRNIKITAPEDLVIALALLRAADGKKVEER